MGRREFGNWLALAMALGSVWSARVHALPAFAIREKASCVLCHTNGSAPHLTKFGYLYRRAGYRQPRDIGNADSDEKAMRLSEHLAVGLATDYEYATNEAAGASSFAQTANQFDVRDLEVWPLVGAFFGRVGVYSKIDAIPSFVSPGTATKTSGGVSMTHGEATYVHGSEDFFFTTRAGLLVSQGYGASDQWIDDGNLPFLETFTARYNQDTLVLPVGADGAPQLGLELGANFQKTDSHFSAGIYNGFDGTNGLATKSASTANPILFNGYLNGQKDFKLQLDQFFGENTAVTAVFYHGTIPLLDPTNSVVWQNHYSTWRLYATESILPSLVDLFAGASYGTYDYAQPGAGRASGTFNSSGQFLGANYYVMPHLTLSGRYDHFDYGHGAKANGIALMTGVPFDYMIINFHYNWTHSDINGITHDLRVEWRLLL